MNKFKYFYNLLKLIPALVFIIYLIVLLSDFRNTDYDIRVYFSLFSAVMMVILFFIKLFYFAIFTEIVFIVGTFMGLFITQVVHHTTYGLKIFGLELTIIIQPLFLVFLITHSILNFDSIKKVFIAFKKFYNGE